MPRDAVLCGLLLLVSFFMAHCAVKVPETMWIEPVVLWIAIAVPTGSGKTLWLPNKHPEESSHQAEAYKSTSSMAS